MTTMLEEVFSTLPPGIKEWCTYQPDSAAIYEHIKFGKEHNGLCVINHGADNGFTLRLGHGKHMTQPHDALVITCLIIEWVKAHS